MCACVCVCVHVCVSTFMKCLNVPTTQMYICFRFQLLDMSCWCFTCHASLSLEDSMRRVKDHGVCWAACIAARALCCHPCCLVSSMAPRCSRCSGWTAAMQTYCLHCHPDPWVGYFGSSDDKRGVAFKMATLAECARRWNTRMDYFNEFHDWARDRGYESSDGIVIPPPPRRPAPWGQVVIVCVWKICVDCGEWHVFILFFRRVRALIWVVSGVRVLIWVISGEWHLVIFFLYKLFQWSRINWHVMCDVMWLEGIQCYVLYLCSSDRDCVSMCVRQEFKFTSC